MVIVSHKQFIVFLVDASFSFVVIGFILNLNILLSFTNSFRFATKNYYYSSKILIF